MRLFDMIPYNAARAHRTHSWSESNLHSHYVDWLGLWSGASMSSSWFRGMPVGLSFVAADFSRRHLGLFSSDSTTTETWRRS